MSIRIEHVSKSYGTQKALNDVSFTVEKGQITGFIGPNGAGKSSMMKIITGFLIPDEGHVFVDELNIFDDPLKSRFLVGYLPENNPLYLSMYVREYLEFIAGMYNLGKRSSHRITELIEQTGLGIEKHKKIGSLSKGYRQRVGIAQALMHDPKILILDEPTSGLDPNQIVEIRSLISELGKDKTVMLSTHIMSEVEAICQKIILINRGTIAADESTHLLLSENKEGQQTVLLELNKAANISLLAQQSGIMEIKEVGPCKYLVSGSIEPDVRNQLFNFAVSQNLVVLSMQRQEKTMEEVFRELTEGKKFNK